MSNSAATIPGPHHNYSVPTVTFLVVTPVQCCSRKSRNRENVVQQTGQVSCCLGDESAAAGSLFGVCVVKS
ncbi:hypothetical protein FJTKL_09739 [Diaporthe vaccinii]|uniref:Uncharacterized protein n=1 Tax=Diaporthe vaccinii TaxID=105482 RepID=A0ABR4EMM4_9PEZI